MRPAWRRSTARRNDRRAAGVRCSTLGCSCPSRVRSSGLRPRDTMNWVSERVVEDDVVFETKAMSMRWVPLTLFATNGVLRLDHGRFTFSTRHGAPKLDTAASELHSVAPM